MATTIKLKSGSGAPLAGDLVAAEPAFDLTNKRLYTEDSGGTVIEVGTNPGTDVTFADNRKAIFGAGSDLQIYHTGSDSRILDTGTGNLRIMANDLRMQSALGEQYITADDGGAVTAYYDNAAKLATTSTGIDVTGDVNSDSVTTGTFTSTGIDDNATSTAITIDSSENVGIGETSPDSVLHVNSGTGNNTAFFESTDNGAIVSIADNAGSIQLRAIDTGDFVVQVGGDGATTGTNSTEAMRIDANGNVGIGTDSPAVEVEVASAAPQLRLTDTDGGYCEVTNVSGNLLLQADKGNSQSSSYMRFDVDNSERMRIDSSGNVGIGTSSPNNTLQVRGASTTGGPSSGNVARFEGPSGTNGLKIFVDDSANASGLQTIATDDLLLNPLGGNVGIGTTSPSGVAGTILELSKSGSTRLNISAGDSSYSAVDFSDTSADGSGRIEYYHIIDAMRFWTNGSETMRIDSSGNLLVFRTTPGTNAAKIDVQSASDQPFLEGYMPTTGVTRAAFVVRSNVGSSNTAHLVVRADGDVENTNNNYGSLSDERLKSNIVDASSQLDDIMAVQVRSYTLNATGETHIGVVAQELEASGMSGLVQEDEEGMKSVKYSILYMKAIKALQEAVTRIETLEAEVAALKGA